MCGEIWSSRRTLKGLVASLTSPWVLTEWTFCSTLKFHIFHLDFHHEQDEASVWVCVVSCCSKTPQALCINLHANPPSSSPSWWWFRLRLKTHGRLYSEGPLRSRSSVHHQAWKNSLTWWLTLAQAQSLDEGERESEKWKWVVNLRKILRDVDPIPHVNHEDTCANVPWMSFHIHFTKRG